MKLNLRETEYVTPKYATIACGLFLPKDNQSPKDLGRDVYLPLNCQKEFRKPESEES